ncbi:MAG: DHA2 family efflux MFS transporter permease subunit [Gammaproteobacteria bacterium]|nr:DHA2 family efflux MFS transporter permease subunit [Gammaproteobacteria bacterium]
MPIINKPATGPFTRRERIIITVPVLMASLLHAVNMSTAYVALPNIQGNLSATPDQIGWIITAFVVASAVGTVLTGFFSSRFGRRNVFLAAIVGFTLTGGLCASATGLVDLVLFRMLQGFVSAPLLPISQSIMLDTYPRERHGFAMSIWSMGMILGPVLGPTIGALVTEWYGWRLVFFINVPLGVVAFIGIALTLPEAARGRQRFDWLGVTTLIVGVSALQLMLDRGQQLDWFESLEIQLEAAVAVLCLYMFVVHSLTSSAPYLDLSMFTDRNYAVGLCLIFIFGIAAFATMFILPLFLQAVQHYPVLTAGWLLSARGLGTMLAMFSSGLLADRFPPKYLILCGLLCIGISSLVMTGWSAEVEMHEVIWMIVLSGFGMGMMWVSLTTVTFSTLSPELRVDAAALFALVRAIGASMGTSVTVAVLVRSSQVNYIELKDHISSGREYLTALAPQIWSIDSTSGLLSMYKLVLSQAQMIGFINTFMMLSVVIFATVPLVFFFKSKPKSAH